MTDPARHDRIMELFDQACDLEASALSAFLDEACDGDEALRREVESLLAHDASDHAAVLAVEDGIGLQALVWAVDADEASPPDHIGQYRIIRELGRGGMGLVFEAEQESPRRRVALKIIREGFASAEMRRRFRYEAEVLGQLHHPGIAHVYEAGAAQVGRSQLPFFAMEYIEGLPLDRHARENDLSSHDRLELVGRICDAVQHAHQKGILHRDLKPANVLITREASGVDSSNPSHVIDAVGQPKVLDFGVARAITDNVAASQHTQSGQIIGTLAYMSPEQIAGDSSQLDTRTDVYSIGVLLYELLAERLPHDIAGMGIAEAASTVRNTDPPRLGAVKAGLRGDVDTIVAKAMEKDRDRRYGSAAELADDIRRHLRDEPIVARPATTFYQLRKFARRNRGLVGGLVTAFLAISIGLAVTTYSLLDAVGQRNAVAATNHELSAVVGFQNDLLSDLDAKDVGRTLLDELVAEFKRGLDGKAVSTADQAKAMADFKQMLERVNATNLARDLLGNVIAARATKEIDSGFTHNPMTEAQLRQGVGGIYSGLGMNEQALEQLQRAAELSQPWLEGDHRVARKIRFDLAVVQKDMGRYADAAATLNDLLDVVRRRSELETDFAERVLNALGQVAHAQGQLDEAVSYHEKALAVAVKNHGPQSDSALYVRNNLAVLEAERGDVNKALKHLQSILEVRHRKLGDMDSRTIVSLNNVMGMLFKRGRLAEAEKLADKLVELSARYYGDQHPKTLLARNNLGRVVMDQGRHAEAEAIFRKVYDVAKRDLAPTNEIRSKCTSNLIDALLALDRPSEAETLCQELLDVRRGLNPPQPVAVAQTLEQLGHACYQQARYEDARDAWQECLDLRSGVSKKHWLTNRARSHLGAALTKLGKYAEAEKLLTKAYAGLKGQEAKIPPVAGAGCVEEARQRLIDLYTAWGKPDRAAKFRNE